MKKLVVFFTLVILGLTVKAQTPSYNQLVSIVKEKLPNLDLSNKLIAIHFWSASNKVSRETNKQFDKAYGYWENAKLKNGTKGLVIISCNIDDVTTGSITAGKDGIVKMPLVNKNDYAFLKGIAVGTNLVYDNTTTKVYQDLTSDNVFNSFNQLLTR
jgi:hypothetical protein